ncbi:MAG: alpha/beta hydrolase [Anaerolineae bacterium]|nr:alpha/beta hydrolase [Anaerolineae bacterium]
MPSLQSRVFIFALQHSHLLRFQLRRRDMITWDTPIEDFRREAESGAKTFGKLPAQIKVTPVTIGDDLYAEWIMPDGARKDKVLLYFHGGGYVSGSCLTHRTHVAKFAQRSGIAALLFDYRVAPEHPFPAAIEDAVAAYRWLLAQGIAPSQIVFAGDSAGGGLCLATLLALREEGLAYPAAVAALSPWTDLLCTGDSLVTKRKLDPFTPGEAWTVFSKYYAGDHDPGLPLISPLYGDLHGLPPILVSAGDHDVLFDDSARFVEKARAAGVDAALSVGEGLFHCYPVCAPSFPEADQAMNEICAFFNRHLNN